jgi:hypothetical protein
MKTKFLIALLTISLVAGSCGKKNGGTNGPGSSDEIELRLNLTKGKKYDLKMMMESNVEMNMMGQSVNSVSNMEMGMDYEVKDVLPSGNFLVRTTYKKVKMSGETMGMKYDFDTETGTANGMQGQQMAESMKKMIGEYSEMEMDKLGKVISTTMSPALTGKDAGKKGGFENFSYSVFPDKKIKVGDTWDSDVEQNMNGLMMTVKTKYKLVSIKDGLAEISLDGTLELKPGSDGKISGTQTGTGKIEIATGISKEMIMNQDVEMEMSDMGMKMPMKMKNKITITMN